jgi:hypothetical protein
MEDSIEHGTGSTPRGAHCPKTRLKMLKELAPSPVKPMRAVWNSMLSMVGYADSPDT